MAHVVSANYAPSVNTETFSTVWKLTRTMKKAGWVYKASSDGTTKDTTANPANDKWGAPLSTGNTGSSGAIGTKAGDDLTLTSLSGMTASSVGRYLTITGAANGGNNGTFQIVAYVSSSSVKIRNTAGVASDANAITWTEKDDTNTLYSSVTLGAVCWWCAQGPSTLKIPFTTAPSGVFVKRETVTQAATGAKGEVLGVTYDAGTGIGYMVVGPQVTGTAGGRKGWDTSVITGSSSGATVTPSAAIIEFVREVVFLKMNSVTLGGIYYQCVDASAENTSRFSYLAANAAGCTATVAPGQGGTGNTLPTAGTYVVKSNGASTGTNWHNTTTFSAGPFGNAQLIAANCIESDGVTADGTLVYAVYLPSSAFGGSTGNPTSGWSLQRLDNTEDGDVEPFTWWMPGGNVAFGSRSRTTDSGASDVTDGSFRSVVVSYSTRPSFIGWRRRGLSSGDAFVELAGALPAYAFQTTPVFPMGVNLMETHSSAARPKITKEPIWIVNHLSGTKVRKGTCRWMFIFTGGSAYQTWANKTWVQFYYGFANSLEMPLLVGPWDGVSTPFPSLNPPTAS